MPSRAAYPPVLAGLISSTSYPPLPSLDELESLRVALESQSAAVAARVAAARADEERRFKKKKQREQRERDERDERDERAEADARSERERERAAIEANERASYRLEAIERRKKEGSAAVAEVKRERKSVSPAPSNASSVSFRPQPYVTTYAQHKKKKKRIADSDDDAPPTPQSHTASTSGLKLKLAPALTQPKARPADAPPPPPTHPSAAGLEFFLVPPPQRPLVPARPGVAKPMRPGPKKQSEVDEDFSDKKAPSQIAFQTFWQNIEPYIRDIREDDLAMLNFKADAPESFDVPPRGRHYTEVWDEEDGKPLGSTSRVPVPNMRPVPAVPARFNPLEMRDEHLVDEARGLGAFTERVTAALIGGAPGVTAGVPEQEVEVQRDGVRDAAELEARMKAELRAAMLLGEHDEFEADPARRDDDDVSAALRQCQRLLLAQTAANDARKARLAQLATHRIAYAEYQATLDGIDKAIEAGWAKRIKKHGSAGRRTLLASGAEAGQGRPPVPDHLKKLVETRKTWIENVGKVLRERPQGEVVGLPIKSVYEGLDSEERDERTVEDAMDVDEMDVEEVEGLAV
ncbi:Transcriptional regulator [Cryptotrichosporon argae]